MAFEGATQVFLEWRSLDQGEEVPEGARVHERRSVTDGGHPARLELVPQAPLIEKRRQALPTCLIFSAYSMTLFFRLISR